jgi:AcrR family transcriptional regulator
VAKRDPRDTTKALHLMWGEPSSPSRGPKPAMSREQIVQAAIAIADRAGLGELSMRSVAEKLGFTTMSLYRYVPGRAELLELMRDAAIGEPPSHDPDAPWRTQLAAWARADLEVHQRHHWMLEMEIRGPPMGPNALRWLDAAMAILMPLGLPMRELLDSVTAVDSYVRGTARFVVGIAREQRRSRGSAAEIERAYRRVFEVVAASPRYPALGQVIAAGILADGSPDAVFEYGLARMLEGIAERVAAIRSPKRR